MISGKHEIGMYRRDLLKALAAAVPVSLAHGMRGQEQRKSYQANWDSLDQRPSPQWYTDAKFGIFIHWGVYSVPSYAPVHAKHETPYAEWYWHSLTAGRNAARSGQQAGADGMHTWQFHKRVYGGDFPYQNFAPMFRAELFDPDQWADVFARSGAKYVALTSKHHEGFTLWQSAEANRSWSRPWNAVDIGPKRDLLAAVTDAGRRRGLRMGIYYSLYEWYNPLWLSDRNRYVTEHFIPQFKDVVNHVKPSIIFADGEWEMTSPEWRSPEVLAWLFNESPVADEVVIDDRWGKDTRHKHGGYYTTEYTAGMQSGNHPWEECRGMGLSFGYNRMEKLADYRTERELILMLTDIVSRGGNLLLDIGPTADGRIPVIMEERLTQIGNWLKVNGEAIYATKPWKRARQWSNGTIPKTKETDFMGKYEITQMVDAPPPGFAHIEALFTAKDKDVFAIIPRRPSGDVILKDMNIRPEGQITLLANGETLRWGATDSGIIVEVPGAALLPSAEAYVFKIQGAV
jgi:alpha-L-fucosidase